jgi:Toprim-like
VKKLWDDPTVDPESGDDPATALAESLGVAEPPCAAYLSRRRIPLEVARAAGVRYAPRFAGRAAVLAPMRRRDGELAAVTARYLTTVRGQEKILTVGHEGGVFAVLDGLRADPLVLVEGVFDALSLAVCGVSCVATIGRYVAWLAEIATGRMVLLGFDGNKVGDHAARYYQDRMPGADCRRLRPPPSSKDWSAAVGKLGAAGLTRWLATAVPQPTTAGVSP